MASWSGSSVILYLIIKVLNKIHRTLRNKSILLDTFAKADRNKGLDKIVFYIIKSWMTFPPNLIHYIPHLFLAQSHIL